MLSGDQAVGRFPKQWSDQQEHQQGDSQGDSPDTAAILLLLFENAEGAHDYATSAMGYRSFAVCLTAGNGRQ
jgi:hypothetical protein